MAEHLYRFAPGQDITFAASAAVTGGQLVSVSGDMTVAPAGANDVDVVGVAGHDAPSGADLTVQTGGVHRLTASDAGAITAGQKVVAGAAGTIAAYSSNPDRIVGVALEAIAAESAGSVLLQIS